MLFVFLCEYCTIFTVQKQDIYALYLAPKGAGFTALFDKLTLYKIFIIMVLIRSIFVLNSIKIFC
jgi:hypothetical protein